MSRGAPSVLNARQLGPGWSDDPRLVYVGRPSPWGNPYGVAQLGVNNVSTRADAIAAFRDYAERRLLGEPHWLDGLREATALVCWCAPQSCHAEILIELLTR